MAVVVGVKFHFMVVVFGTFQTSYIVEILDLGLLAIDPVVAPGIISSDDLGSFHTLRSISKTGRVPGFSIDFFFKKIIRVKGTSSPTFCNFQDPLFDPPPWTSPF